MRVTDGCVDASLTPAARGGSAKSARTSRKCLVVTVQPLGHVLRPFKLLCNLAIALYPNGSTIFGARFLLLKLSVQVIQAGAKRTQQIALLLLQDAGGLILNLIDVRHDCPVQLPKLREMLLRLSFSDSRRAAFRLHQFCFEKVDFGLVFPIPPSK